MSIVDAIKSSPVFMNALFDQITSAVFIVDCDYRVMAFNNTFQDMVKKAHAQMYHHLCGNVLGCAYTGFEQSPCGTTAFCESCELRSSIRDILQGSQAVTGQIIEREFIVEGELLRKYFRYAAKPIDIQGQHFALLIVDDITLIEEKKAALLEQNAIIGRLNQKFQRDLILAKRVQDSIIPKKALRINGYSIDFRYYPLEAIGGDMFDIYILDQERVGILMCDVVGHGLPAALITTMLKALVEGSRHLLEHPKSLIRHINRKIIAILGDVYLTAVYGILNTSEHQFNFVRAGHPNPWAITGSLIHSIGHASNMMLGVEDSVEFLDDQFIITQKSKVLLYTDGLLEAGTLEGPYEKRLVNLIEQHPQCSGNELLESIEGDLEDALIHGRHEDDICVLIIERL